jgi:hypothetical protein
MCNMQLLSQALPPSQMKNPNRKFNENKLLELRTFQFLICPVLQVKEITRTQNSALNLGFL